MAIGTDTVDETAVELGPAEREMIYAEQANPFPQYGEHAAGTDRTIPVIELT